jgi:hypothetical protein
VLGHAQVRLVVALLAGKAGGLDMAVVAEGYIPILHLEEDVASSDLRKREGGQEQGQADADNGNNFHSHSSLPKCLVLLVRMISLLPTACTRIRFWTIKFHAIHNLLK